VERRNAVRYQLCIPVIFSWEEEEGMRHRGEGMTRDISEVGVFISTPNCPQIGSVVEVQVLLSTQPGHSSASLKSKMHVTRVENEPQEMRGSGFAVAGKAFTLRNNIQ
jgi:hypothetical protein